jgi:hypothetical protein
VLLGTLLLAVPPIYLYKCERHFWSTNPTVAIVYHTRQASASHFTMSKMMLDHAGWAYLGWFTGWQVAFFAALGYLWLYVEQSCKLRAASLLIHTAI